MSFRFITYAFAEYFSHVKYIWFDEKNNNYLITDDQREMVQDPNFVDDSYMLFPKQKQQFYESNYRTKLDNVIKILTEDEIKKGYVRLKLTFWKFKINS